MRKKMLVAGGMGVVGRALIEHLSGREDWEVIGLSRRSPNFETSAKFVSVDLADRESSIRALRKMGEITHVLYAALVESTSLVEGWKEAEHTKINLAMMTNFLDGVEQGSPELKHVSLMHGGKAYGVHLGPPPRVPSRESDPHAMPPNFYYDQEAVLRERQAGKSWTWTILRPPAVCGFAVGSPMNTTVMVGMLAAISRELGVPLRFPGSPGHLKDACDAKLLARAIEWAGQSENAHNQVFNIANGDAFTWEQVFPKIAELFGMESDFPHPMSLSRVMADKAPLWERMIKKYGLQPYAYEQLIPSWGYTDWTFRLNQVPFNSVLSTIKIRQAGFQECLDTEGMFVTQIQDLQRRKILPP
jgi:nucleoside-diphosphate-sugar epimerase